MKLSVLLNQSKQTFTEFWAARDPRERAMLAAAAAVAALGLIYALLIDPALSGRDRLNKSLPELRLQAAVMQSLSKEAALYAGLNAAPVATVNAEVITATLTAKGLKPQNVAMSGDLAKVQLAATSFAGILNWLDEMQRTSRLLVIDANFVATDKPDTVNATLTLRQQRSE